jgi:caspase 7
MEKKTTKFAMLDHSRADMIIVAVLSHGDEGEIEGVDGKFVKEKTLLSMFTDENCPDLAGKPKLFIFLHCR